MFLEEEVETKLALMILEVGFTAEIVLSLLSFTTCCLMSMLESASSEYNSKTKACNSRTMVNVLSRIRGLLNSAPAE